MKLIYSWIILFLLSHSVFAVEKNVDIRSKVFFRGEKLGSPFIKTQIGKRARVGLTEPKNNNRLSLEFQPMAVRGNKVRIGYLLAIKGDNNETFSRGGIWIEPGEKGRISIDKGEVELHLEIN